MRAEGGLVVTPVPVESLDDDQLAQWSALHAAQEGVANPFTSPAWVTTWYRHFVPRRDRRLLWVTDRGRLVGVAPMYERAMTVSRVPVARRLLLVGSGRPTPLEIPALLCVAGNGRAVVRSIVEHALTYDVAWTELCLAPGHGWLNAHLANRLGRPPVFQRHQQARTCVVLPLADTWDRTRSGLKRNVKESVRRARNRLAKDGRPSQIRARTGADLDVAAVDRLLGLHGARSQYQGSTSQHRDAFADPAHAAFARDVLTSLGQAGEASIMELELAGEVVAAQLVLHPPGGVYFHSSGFLPQVWELSPVTALQAATMELAIGRGERWANFSPGPNEAKLRWSEQLATFEDFAFGAASMPTVARYTAFFIAKDLRQLQHERAWVRRTLSRPEGTASADVQRGHTGR